MPYGVYDPQPELPEEGTKPKIYVGKDGWSEHEAESYANVLHPDDMSGDCVVVEVEVVG